MNFNASFRLAWNILVHSKLRSWLTILGIIIGVAAVIIITSIGNGAQVSLQQRLGTLGTNTLSINPGGDRAGGVSGAFRGGGGGGSDTATKNQKNLTSRDVQMLAALPSIKTAMGTYNGRASGNYQGQITNVQIRGVDAVKWRDITTSTLQQGNLLQPSDLNGAVIGNRIATEVFKNPPIIINSKININGIEVKVIGILNPSTGFGSSEDGAIIVVEKTARQILGNTHNDYGSITVIPYDGQNNTEVANQITQKLELLRGESDTTRTFSVTSSEAARQTLQDTVATLTLFLDAIAVISLLVGAIGIANTMFTAVLERTKDIGVMKAVGVEDSDVLLVFIINAGLVGLAGGIIGVLLGVFVSSFISKISLGIPGSGGGLTAIVTTALVFEMLAFSIVIGVIAGIIPAYNASRLKPSIALKYE